MHTAHNTAPADRAQRRSPAWGTLVQGGGVRRMPAEWEPHEATWLGWPLYVPEQPAEWDELSRTLAEIVRVLHLRERVEILCPDPDVRARARAHLAACRVAPSGYRLHISP